MSDACGFERVRDRVRRLVLMGSIMLVGRIGRHHNVDTSRPRESFGQALGVRHVRFKCLRAASGESREAFLAASRDAHLLVSRQKGFSDNASGISCGTQNDVHGFLLASRPVIYDAGESGEDTFTSLEPFLQHSSHYNIGMFTPVFFAKAIASGYPASTCRATPI